MPSTWSAAAAVSWTADVEGDRISMTCSGGAVLVHVVAVG
jgi:hypothetical protein